MKTLQEWLYKVNGTSREDAYSLDLTETSSHFYPHQNLTLLCGCGYQYVAEINCGNRLCNYCAGKAAWRIRKRYLKLIKNMAQPKLMTLTLPTTRKLTKARIRFIRASFSKIRRQEYYRIRIRGGIYVIEIKKSNGLWNVHIHALINSVYIDEERLCRDWCKLTGAYIADVENAWSTRGGLEYLLKYISKPGRFNSQDSVVYRESMKGTRLIQDFGNLFNQSVRPLFHCPNCGATEWITVEYMDILKFEAWGGSGLPP